MASVPERVAQFLIGKKPNDFCDDCIATALKLARVQQAQQATSGLGSSTDYVRHPARCHACGREEMVIHKL
jgi:hypothetical protein